MRTESDSLGYVNVASDKYWGAQTERALQHFSLREDLMPLAIIRSLTIIKMAAAAINADLGLLPEKISKGIIQACEEVLCGKLTANFPLGLWQSGSGTQSNMNVNEVIANRAIEILGGTLGTKDPVHPNDHVNLGQSTNDCFPSAMHMAALEQIAELLLPALEGLRTTLQFLEQKYESVLKVGRTHLMDATPLYFGQEISGYRAQLSDDINRLQITCGPLHSLAIGGTAVGTGINTHPRFSDLVIKKISQFTNRQFYSSTNKFSALASHDPMVFAHSALKTLATNLNKIANDIRWLASGPRCGLQEITLPTNEPGSSIMPGKVNPSQCEVVTMVCTQVFANDVAITLGGASGNFELNAYKPLIAYNFLNSVRLLTGCITDFNKHCMDGLTINQSQLSLNLERTLMLSTYLSPHIGYDRAAEVANEAFKTNSSLKEAGLRLNYFDEQDFDNWVQIENLGRGKNKL